MKVLVTCGPTWVALDEVRVISNQSTGTMGHLIALEFLKAGHAVTVIEGQVLDPLSRPGIKVIKFKFFAELAGALEKECRKKYDVIIHAAAVSDFEPKKRFAAKLDSHQSFTLTLVPTKKLINGIKRLSPQTFLVGFKLEPKLNRKNALAVSKDLFDSGGCDIVVANSIRDKYLGFILNAEGKILTQASTKPQLAKALVRVVGIPGHLIN
jgi:phosphopantothenoylcysteine decarboxylase / phosphopantothenate---cysteine ligase